MGVVFVRTYLPISGRVVLKGCQYYSVHCDSVYPYCARLSQRLKVYICYMLEQYVSTCGREVWRIGITHLHGHPCTKCQSCIAFVVRCKKSHFPFSAELICVFVRSSRRMRVGTRILCEEQKTPIGRRGLEHQVCKLPCTYSPTFLLRRDLGFGSHSW